MKFSVLVFFFVGLFMLDKATLDSLIAYCPFPLPPMVIYKCFDMPNEQRSSS